MHMVRRARVGPDADPTGGRWSFAELYEREYRPVVGLAYALTGSRAVAEELAQDAFTAAYRNWAQVSGYDQPATWVRRVLVNASRSWGRRRGAELRALTRLRNRRPLAAELAEADHEFWAAVRRLPTRQSQAVALHYLEDRPVGEIAEILGVSIGSVKTHLHRGRHGLADALGLDPTTDRIADDEEDGR